MFNLFGGGKSKQSGDSSLGDASKALKEMLLDMQQGSGEKPPVELSFLKQSGQRDNVRDLLAGASSFGSTAPSSSTSSSDDKTASLTTTPANKVRCPTPPRAVTLTQQKVVSIGQNKKVLRTTRYTAMAEKKGHAAASDPGTLLQLRNNSAISIDDDSGDINKPATQRNYHVIAPALGSGDAIETSNSNFCKIRKIIDYNWEKMDDVNLLTVHRTLPIIAYVINVEYSKKAASKKAGVQSNPEHQAIRIMNYEDQNRGLTKEKFYDTVTDLAFSFSRDAGDSKLALVDRSSNIYLFEFHSFPESQSIKLTKLVTIKSGINNISLYNHQMNNKLAWCPAVPDEFEPEVFEPSLKLAVGSQKHIEIFSLDRIIEKSSHGHSECEKSFFNHQNGEYVSIPNTTAKPLSSIHISNDGTAICIGFADNLVKFFQLSSPDSSGPQAVQVLRTWTPPIAPEAINYFCFLDDYDFLLTNTEYHFWGYVFVGTRNGALSLWDLRSQKWACIQQFAIECEVDDNSTSVPPFSYHVDTSAHAILAVSGLNAFLLLVDFQVKNLDRNSANNNGDSETEEILEPRIKQIARFQLYSPVISFSVKRVNAKEVDVFWVTQKSLERCTIELDSLSELIHDNNSFCSPASVFANNKRTSKDSSFGQMVKPEPVTPQQSQQSTAVVAPSIPTSAFTPVAPSLQPKFSNVPPTNLMPVGPPAMMSTPNNASMVSMMQHMSQQAANPVFSSAQQKERELLTRVHSTSQQLERLKRQSDPQAAASESQSTSNNSTPLPNVHAVPDSRTLPVGSPGAGLFAKLSAPDGPPPLLLQRQLPHPARPLFGQPIAPMGAHHMLGHPMPHPGGFIHAAPIIQPVPLQHPQMAFSDPRLSILENRISLFEAKMEGTLTQLGQSVTAAVGAVHADVAQLKMDREEFVARDQRLTETVVERVVRKSMSQLNLIVTEGLKDFFEQVKSEVDTLEGSVSQSSKDLNAVYGDINTQMVQLQQKMEIFQKQLEKNEAEQQLLLYRFQQQQQMVQNPYHM